MTSRFAFNFLRISITVIFYFLLLITLIYVISSALQFAGSEAGNQTGGRIFQYDVKAFENIYNVNDPGVSNEEVPSVSADGHVSYQGIYDEFKVKVEPRSSFGLYAFISGLVFLLMALAILWQFKKIFRKPTIHDPFNNSVIRQLKILAGLFITTDVFGLLNYFIVNSFLNTSLPDEDFQLLTDVGSGLITGMVILVIVVMLERGKEIKEEHALTV